MPALLCPLPLVIRRVTVSAGGIPPLASSLRGTWDSHTTGYGQQAGGTHPTGMHSCFNLRACFRLFVALQAMAGAYGFFGALRHLSVKVDNETHKLKEKMTGERQKNKPEDATLLLLELQNEMKSLHVSEYRVVKNSQDRSCTGREQEQGRFFCVPATSECKIAFECSHLL